ncbi:hypothetical protein ACH429_16715 [Streptomyces pathocidini]|uniref:Uncharacterized protein n=1 Tax=Streptomyces pathocidini TaxID=1650571 RepID=A0ABW7USY8_9ACTN|nr:hypothetical protein [Streptomyces pathocidini]
MRAAVTSLLNRHRPYEPQPCGGLAHDDAALARAARGALTRAEQICRVAAAICGANVGWACERCTRRAERIMPSLVVR